MEHLKELYEAASLFKQAQPWNWLYDAEIICVENPKDETMGYCSIMGRVGEHYSLGVYLGYDGISGFSYMMENSDNMPSHQILHYQDCLMCSFEDRDQLTNKDRKQIKDLGLSFRGRNAWPMFRRFKPGFSPWFINDEECVFLTHALRQSLFVASNVLTGQLSMDMAQGKTILRFSEEKDGELEWFTKEVWMRFPTVRYNPVTITDEVIIQKIKMQEISILLSRWIPVICLLLYRITRVDVHIFPECS